jgi:hypothetical protein
LVIAEHAFTEAQKLVPAETAPYVNMAQILIHDQRFDEAQHWIEAGLAVDANHCGLWEILAWVFQQQEIPDHPKSLEKMARERNSWAGLSLVADLVAPEEPERKLMFLEGIYNVKALDFNEWMLVLAFSVPVIFDDEILKFVGRTMRTDHEQEGAKETHVQWIQQW